MKDQIKNRITSFSPENGLKENELFFIRTSPHCARGGKRNYHKILIYDNFDFNCVVDEYAGTRSVKFYINGRVPRQLITLLSKISNDLEFRVYSMQTEKISNLSSYGGNFDISFRVDDENSTYYIDCSHIELISKKERKLEDEFLMNFGSQFSLWLNSLLQFRYIDFLQKGILGFVMEYK